MPRSPGTPSEKDLYLRSLDERALPYLAADILYYVYHHRNVRVTDGPGDGKRDVHSETSSGHKHITQCKFRKDATKTASSSDTDELILALHKFGVKHGAFFTNARISPQAKREYLDSYPDFRLDFFEGADIVDAALSIPFLSATWLQEGGLRQPVLRWSFPFVLRTASDTPIIVSDLSPAPTGEQGLSFSLGRIERSLFHPYRPPSESPWREAFGDQVTCMKASLTSNVQSPLRHPADIMLAICRSVQKKLDEDAIISIRFAHPSATDVMASASRTSGGEILYKLGGLTCRSFVIDKDRVHSERDWVAPVDIGFPWQFPDNLSVAEAEWCSFLNRDLNLTLETFVRWPRFNESFLSQHQLNVLRQKYLKRSLFLEVTDEQAQAIDGALEAEALPTSSLRYGPGGHLLAWLHPGYLQVDLPEGQVLRPTPALNEVEHYFEPDEREYLQVAEKVRALATDMGLPLVNWERAVKISDIEGSPLVPVNNYQEFNTADLAHYFHEIPSPVFLSDRHVQFVQMWSIKEPPDRLPDEDLIHIAPSFLHGTKHDISILSRLYRGGNNGKLYLGTCIDIRVPSEWPMRRVVDNFTTTPFKTLLLAIAEVVFRRFPGAVLSTVDFFRDGVGFIVTNTDFKGNPWTIVHETSLETGEVRGVKKRWETIEEFKAILSEYRPRPPGDDRKTSPSNALELNLPEDWRPRDNDRGGRRRGRRRRPRSKPEHPTTS